MTILLLLVAGLVGGTLNTLAGGGSFIMFPALLAAGVPPVLANASNTYACLPGYVSGALGYRRHLLPHRGRMLRYGAIGLVGGVLGAELLLAVPEETFSFIIPWLMGFAVLVYIFGARASRALAHMAEGRRGMAQARIVGLAAILFAVCIYGGFFNAGLGIILLAYLALEGLEDVHLMNGLKLFISSIVSVVAVIRFAAEGSIAWFEGSLALAGAVTGGYLAAHFAPHVPAKLIRGFVIAYGIGLTLYFFSITY